MWNMLTKCEKSTKWETCQQNGKRKQNGKHAVFLAVFKK